MVVPEAEPTIVEQSERELETNFVITILREDTEMDPKDIVKDKLQPADLSSSQRYCRKLLGHTKWLRFADAGQAEQRAAATCEA